MKNLGTVTLETNRLILRKFNMDDGEVMFHNWASDNEVTKYLMWPAHKSLDISKEYIKSLISNYSDPRTYDWGIELKEIGQVIGSIGVVRLNEEVGSAFSAVIKFLTEEVGVNRIESRHDTRNINSGKVMEKCGLKYEGTLRQSDINNQGICDAAWYSLLKEDYKMT